MTKEELYQVCVTYINLYGLNLVVVAAVGYLIKKLLENRLLKDVEAAKQKIQQANFLELENHKKLLALETEQAKSRFQVEANREIENLKAQLQIYSHESQSRFAKIFEEQHRALVSIHRSVFEVRISCLDAVKDLEGMSAYKDTLVKVQKCFDLLQENAIYFKADRVQRWCEILNDLLLAMHSVKTVQDAPLKTPDERLIYCDAFNKFNTAFNVLQTEITSDIRVILKT